MVIQAVVDYSKDCMMGLQQYSSEKVGQVIDSTYGKAVSTNVSSVLHTADNYVDYYLPGDVMQQTVDCPGNLFLIL